MLGKFDEGFYRNKRAALASSLALMVASTIPISLHKDAVLFNAFQVGGDASYSLIVFAILLVCVYLNASYLLHYFTEIPGWLKEPSGELKQVDSLNSSFAEIKGQLDQQTNVFSAALKHHDEAMTTLADRLRVHVPQDLGRVVENDVVQRIARRNGEIYIAVFNEISAVLGADRSSEVLFRKNINWETITSRVTEHASRELVSVISSEVSKIPTALETSLSLFIASAEKALLEIRDKETELLREASATNQKIEIATRKLRRWSTLMNIRATVWYLYITLGLFVLALLCAGISIYSGKPAIQLLWGLRTGLR